MSNPLRDGLKRHFSTQQREILWHARIGIAGAGGLGSNAALMLARSGIGNLLLLDDDVVEASNLNRQQYWPRHVGRPKVEALAELLQELNPELQLQTQRLRLDSQNLPQLLPLCPIWVEALDTPEDKRLLVEAALLAGLRVASASGMGGWGGPAMGKRYMGNLILVGDFTSDILQAPALAPRVTQAAALLADAVLEMLLGNQLEDQEIA
jgi:sulfur carrier protein ThiS adenylyltransferase